MYILIFYFILLAVLVSLFGRLFGSKFSINFSIFFLFLSLCLSIFIFYEVILMGYSCEIILFNWFDLFNLYSPFILYFDKLSSSMLFLVLFISSLIHIYASNYMKNDPHILRFFFYLSLFTFFMCLMVISGSLIQFFFAWEGVGLSSYLLIGFWYTRIEANRSAMKAMIINRFGDFGLYFAILLIFVFYKTLLFSSLNAIAHILVNDPIWVEFLIWKISIHDIICFFLFIAVVGKSAQLGLHTWLPDAMEGPTPVSALLHAATMVTAGVYLLLRLSNFFEAAPNVLIIIALWGALTAFFAASIGAFQNDIKKIIAYSTCSQLGYMISSCGLNNFIGAYFHLFNHAFFKALLFLGAGVIIHALNNEQDLRKYGGLLNFLPLTFICMLIASLSLIGLPFLSGYYSKDIIINWAFYNSNYYSQFVYWLLLFAIFFTSFYSIKILNLVFFSKPRFNKIFFKNISESNFYFKLPMILLAIFSFFSGYLFFDLFIGYGNDLLNLNININQNYLLEQEFLTQLRKNLPLLFIFFGILTYILNFFFFSFFFYYLIKLKKFILILLPWKNFFTKKWFFDYFYFYFSIYILKFSYNFLFKSLDKGVFEDIFIKKQLFLSLSLSKFLESFQISNINIYLIFLLLILFFFFLIYILFLNYLLFILFIFYFFYKHLINNEKNS